MSRRLKSPANLLLVQWLVQVDDKENIKTHRAGSLWGEFTGDRWIPLTKGQQWRKLPCHDIRIPYLLAYNSLVTRWYRESESELLRHLVCVDTDNTDQKWELERRDGSYVDTAFSIARQLFFTKELTNDTPYLALDERRGGLVNSQSEQCTIFH